MTRLLAKDLMTADPKTVAPTAPLREVLHLMDQHNIRHVPVVDEGQRLVGLVSHRDVLRSQEGTLSEEPARGQERMNNWIEARWVMTKDVATVRPDTPALQAAETLRARGIGCVPVTHEGMLQGILSESDFVDYAIRSLADPGT